MNCEVCPSSIESSYKLTSTYQLLDVIPWGSWTLQWKGSNLCSRGRVLKIASFEGPMMLRVVKLFLLPISLPSFQNIQMTRVQQPTKSSEWLPFWIFFDHFEGTAHCTCLVEFLRRFASTKLLQCLGWLSLFVFPEKTNSLMNTWETNI